MAVILMQFTGCFMPKTLSRFDIEFENRRREVDSYSKDFGFRARDKIIAYKMVDGPIFEAGSGPENLRIEKAFVEMDSLFLEIKTGTSAESEQAEAIPISQIACIKVRRFYFGPTAVLSGIGLMMLLSLLGVE